MLLSNVYQDDYYGKDGFKRINHDYLKSNHKVMRGCLINFIVKKNTHIVWGSYTLEFVQLRITNFATLKKYKIKFLMVKLYVQKMMEILG